MIEDLWYKNAVIYALNADFYSVDERYGSNGDFVELVQRANGREIRVLIDLVVNHTSDRSE